MTAFALAACLLLLRSDPRRPGIVAGLAALYAAAFLSKETGIVLPAILVLVEMARGETGREGGWPAYIRTRLPLLAVLAGVGIGLLLLRQSVLGSIASATPPLGAAGLQSTSRFWTVVSVWPHYLRLIFWPASQSADYSPNVIPILTGPAPLFLVGLLSGLVVAAIAIISWRGRPLSAAGNSVRAVSTGILFFAVAILPVANLFFLSGVLLAERTLYLPSVGAVLGLGWFANWVLGRARGAGLALLMTALVLMGFGTVSRNPTWLDSGAVFNTMVRDHPESGRSQWFLGQAYFKGELPEDGRRAYERALGTIGPHYPLLVDFGWDLSNTGREAEGVEYLRRAHLLRPDLKTAPHRLMSIFSNQARYDDAEQVARAVVQIDSMDAVAYHLLASIYTEQGRIDDAVEARQRTIAAGETAHWQQWYWLAELLSRSERHHAAGEALDSAWNRTVDSEARALIRSLQQQMQGRLGRLDLSTGCV
jgi:tetratricopeptide (TPR) repeat protein